MKQSQLFLKTRKEVPADADSINASYLIRASFAEKQMAGVYSLLPLGLRVIKKIENIVREEMNKIGGQEVLMNVLQPKELWDETGRSESAVDIFYKLVDARGKTILLAPTHEEQVIDIVRKKVKSYKDLPLALYQIQTKFRNEPRAKSGLLRGREFIMKDLYSFHESEEDFNSYYERSKEAYNEVFKRFGLDARIVEASGGIFSKYSHEFQVLTAVGEDTIYYCDKCDFAQNKEVAEVTEGDKCPKCGALVKVGRGIEVGNIFPLKDKYSKPMNGTFLDRDGKEQVFTMGCYGIGITRALATIVEVHYDVAKNKMVWPVEVAPYKVHLISLNQNEKAEEIYKELLEKNVEVLYDDREMSAGEKFAEADLVGSPIRIVVSKKTLDADSVEMVRGGEMTIVKISDLDKAL
ncbi:MAG: aminoacyl--tRNA ligase-related protein [Patescibacteria group bacterium]|jgi:prolyl-tRNA synthetase